MESTHALDFVSLLLSKHTPRQAELTMSPFLKQNLPMGCVGAEVIQTPQKSPAEQQTEELVSMGWKMQSLGSAADLLLTSATRLEEETKRESTYWNQVLAVKEYGWALCRLPREKHTLGVRYGFAEGSRIHHARSKRILNICAAHSDFRDRGLAALRRDEAGNVRLDRGIKSSDRALRVRVLKGGKPTGSSGQAPESAVGDVPVEKLLLNARNSIFDEELHHELHREARNYANQGVQCVDDKILLPYADGQQIEIDLLSPTCEEASLCNDNSALENTVATGTAIALRVLLSHAHRQNLRRRSQAPPPIAEKQTPRPVYTVLRPIVENLQHRSASSSLSQVLTRLVKILKAAGLTIKVDNPTSPYKSHQMLLKGNNSSVSMTEDFIDALTIPLQSSYRVHLPTALTVIKIDIHTSLQPPFSGTSFQLTSLSSVPGSKITTMPPSLYSSSFTDVEGHLLHHMQLDILSLIASNPDPKGKWTIGAAHAGRMTRRNKARDSLDQITVTLVQDHLSLFWQRHGPPKLKGWKRWDSSGQGFVDEDNQRHGLLESVGEFLQ